jgi:integrase
MGDVFKHRTTRYLDADGRQVKSTTPDARKVTTESRDWYGEYKDAEGVLQRVRLSPDKTAARVMLADLVREAELTRRGLADPAREAQARLPLTEHLKDYRRHLESKGDVPEHVAHVVSHVRKILDGCHLTLPAELAPGPVQDFLAGLMRQGRGLPYLDPGKEEYTCKELALLLGIKPKAVTSLLARHRLGATGKGNGKARRFPRSTAEALRERACEPLAPQTVNHYLAAIKAFSSWLATDRPPRIPSDPLVRLERWSVEEDVRRGRRALPPADLAEVLTAALASPKTFRGMTGHDRHFLYLTAMGTGFRADELASLSPASFALDAEPPTVTCRAGYTKNGKTATQPIPAEIAEALRGYLDGRPTRSPVWPGSWHERAADMLRIDLDAAGIPYAVEGPDGLLFADFHALRHSYIALLDRAGLTLKQAMQLARHSDPKLTMAVYGRASLHDLGAAVDRLSVPVALPRPAALRLTGTDGASGQLSTSDVSSVAGKVARTTAVQGRPESVQDGSEQPETGKGDGAER